MSLVNSLLGKLGGRDKSQSEHSHADAFATPERLFRYLKVNTFNGELDSYSAAAITTLRKKYHVPAHSANQYVRERELIQIAGVLAYVRRAYDADFYTILKSYLIDDVFARRSQNDSFLLKEEIEEVVQYYEDEEDPHECTEFFISRVFGGLALAKDLSGTELILSVSYNDIVATSKLLYEDHMRALGVSIEISN